MASRAGQQFNKFRLIQPRFPEKFKGGRIETFKNYLLKILADYQAVFRDTLQDMKDRPMKASLYLTAIAGLGVLINTSPNHQSFIAQLQSDANDLSLVGDVVRNPDTDSHIQLLQQAKKDCTLKYLCFGPFSVMWIDRFASHTDLYEARCKHLGTPWYKFHQDVVDVGVLHRWLKLEKMMIDYDVNNDEWKEVNISEHSISSVSR